VPHLDRSTEDLRCNDRRYLFTTIGGGKENPRE
jgi:hypothetical protein